MKISNEILSKLLCEGLQTAKADQNFLVSLSANSTIDWMAILDFVTQQGVVAVAYDGLKEWLKYAPLKANLPKPVLLQWGACAFRVEKIYADQWRTAQMLSNYYFDNGIKTIVLKGFAVAQYYPIHNHRSCGDLDCFLRDKYEKGNRLVELKGVQVARDFYKHSEFDINNLHVENHQFCTAIRGSKKLKKFEILLQSFLTDEQLSPIGKSHLYSPPPMFNALFLTKHAMGHFLSEGITLRHYADWALFVESNRNLIDWNKFITYCKEYGLYSFVDTVTSLCVQIYKIKPPFPLTASGKSKILLLNDTVLLSEKSRVFSGPFWKQRYLLIKNTFEDRWKYKMFSDESFLEAILRLAKGFFFDRVPKLK